MKITEEELQERKSRIIHGAFYLFCQNGIDQVSIKDIAKRAAVAEKSVYRYFQTKVNLLMETVKMLWKEIVSELCCSIDEAYAHKSGIEQVEILLEGFRNLFENHANYILFSYDYKLYLIRHSKLMTENSLNDVLRPMYELYIDALEKGKQDGSIGATESAEDLYWAIWGLMRGYVVKIVIYDRMYESKNLWSSRFDVARSMILSGLQNGFHTRLEKIN